MQELEECKQIHKGRKRSSTACDT